MAVAVTEVHDECKHWRQVGGREKINFNPGDHERILVGGGCQSIVGVWIISPEGFRRKQDVTEQGILKVIGVK